MNTSIPCWGPPAFLLAMLLGWLAIGVGLWLIEKIGDWILYELESRPKNDGYMEG